MPATTTAPLVFRRTPSGAYVVDTTGNVEFRALIERGTGQGTRPNDGWRVTLTTFGRPLDFATRRTLNDARDYARLVFETVNV